MQPQGDVLHVSFQDEVIQLEQAMSTMQRNMMR